MLENTFLISIIVVVIMIILATITFKIIELKTNSKEFDMIGSFVATVLTLIMLFVAYMIPQYYKQNELAQAVTNDYNVTLKNSNIYKTHSDWQNITFKNLKNKDVVLSIRVLDWKNNIVEVELPQMANIDYTLESLNK